MCQSPSLPYAGLAQGLHNAHFVFETEENPALLCELLQNRVETSTKTSTKYQDGRHTTTTEWQGLDIKP